MIASLLTLAFAVSVPFVLFVLVDGLVRLAGAFGDGYAPRFRASHHARAGHGHSASIAIAGETL